MGKKKTTEQFIEDAIKVHGDKYDYSKVEYLGNNKDVIVICPIHGESKQRPANHLNNGGCFLCGVEKSTKSKLRSENEFIKKCKKIYGEDYDYSLVDYKTCKDKVKIICKTHGVFKVTGDVFLNNKSGCAKCTTDRKRTKNRSNFLARATEIHGIKYDYSLVDYINNHTKVKIICSEHGVFQQIPLGHLQGNSCTLCGSSVRKGKKQTTEEFIKLSIKTHGEKYDYTETTYINAKTNVDIFCRVHGKFTQNPTKHKLGAGCKKCNSVNKDKNYEQKTEIFIEKAIKAYGDLYDYSLTLYEHSRTPIKVGCKIHGVFEQKPYHHLLGKGCKQCSGLVNVYKRADYIKLTKLAKLYLIRIFNEEEEFYKIGKTKDTIKKRFSNTNIKPYNFEVVYFLEKESGEIFDLEIELHKKYNSYKYKPLNKFSGHTECYNLGLPIQEIINL